MTNEMHSYTALELVALTPDEMRSIAAREAVNHLGFLKPECESMIVEQLSGAGFDRPDAGTTSRRKLEPQLTKEEKKALGLRANAFMSKAALDDLTELGRARPLNAHEQTVLRATFTMFRHRDVKQVMAANLGKVFSGKFQYDVLTKGCPVCDKLNGKKAKVEDVHILPPPGCTCETANYGLRTDVNWNKVFD